MTLSVAGQVFLPGLLTSSVAVRMPAVKAEAQHILSLLVGGKARVFVGGGGGRGGGACGSGTPFQ